MRLTSSTTINRHPLWDKERITQDLRSLSHTGIIKLCKQYGGEEGWRTYYNDVWKWKQLDPDFNEVFQQFLERNSPGMSQPKSGRPRSDLGDKSWQDDYCIALAKYNLNRHRAAQVTPYSFETIYQMLDPEYSSYDEGFAKKVKAIELEISSRAEEMAVLALDEENYRDIETAKITQTKVWVATKVLEKLDPKRWGKQIEMTHKGTINHKHQLAAGSKGELFARLKEEQDAFLAERMKRALPPKPEVIDAEIIDEPVLDPVISQ